MLLDKKSGNSDKHGKSVIYCLCHLKKLLSFLNVTVENDIRVVELLCEVLFRCNKEIQLHHKVRCGDIRQGLLYCGNLLKREPSQWLPL
jgi:hypothetical protein